MFLILCRHGADANYIGATRQEELPGTWPANPPSVPNSIMLPALHDRNSLLAALSGNAIDQRVFAKDAA
ncbi:MAG: hypothetical protein QOJ86_5484 [Bradyrhizobium sp.]|nr:hypothetical protein [Bradyrhizobium sp.]